MILISNYNGVDYVFWGWSIGDASTGIVGIIIYWCLYKRYYNVMRNAEKSKSVVLREQVHGEIETSQEHSTCVSSTLDGHEHEQIHLLDNKKIISE